MVGQNECIRYHSGSRFAIVSSLGDVRKCFKQVLLTEEKLGWWLTVAEKSANAVSWIMGQALEGDKVSESKLCDG